MNVRLLGRHQAAAFAGTGADFLTMLGLVELVKLTPPVATVLSAIVGGFVNFSISRAWAFRAMHRGTTLGQASRYAVVSFGGALLNGVSLAAVLAVLPIPYLLARIAVSVAISVLYTYPLHTRVVFRVAT